MALKTDLELIVTGIPEDVKADEMVWARAGLARSGEPVSGPAALGGVCFIGEILGSRQPPVALEFTESFSGAGKDWPPGTRMAVIPALVHPGARRLVLRAEGQNFRREREIALNITPPWYRGEAADAAGPVPGQVRFAPGRGPRPEELEGWAGVLTGRAQVAARFFKPPPEGPFTLSLGSAAGSCRVDLALSGRLPSGRPLTIRPAALPVDLPAAAASPPSPPPGKDMQKANIKGRLTKAREWLKAQKTWRLAGLGICAAFLAGGFGLLLSMFWRARVAGRTEGGPEAGGSRLRRKAQVEALIKEKGELQAALKESETRLAQETREKEELRGRLERQSHGLQEKVMLIGELEGKLKDMKSEAQAVQEEYTALYARSQAEKQALNKK